MRVEITVTRTYEMDETRVLAEPGFNPPPPDATENDKRDWLRKSFYELCGFERDRDHLDGDYVWLVDEDDEHYFAWPTQNAPAISHSAVEQAQEQRRTFSEEGGVNESSSGVHGQQMSPLPSAGNDRSVRKSASTSPPAESVREQAQEQR